MKTTEKQNSLGQRVRETRLAQFLKGVQLAHAVGISTGYLHDIEISRTSPSLPLLTKIASALNVSADYLLGRTDTPIHEETTKTNNDLSVMVPLLDEEMIKCGYCDSTLREIVSYSSKFYTYSREELGGKYDKEHYPFAVRVKNADLMSNGVPNDCILIVNPALRTRPGGVCVVYHRSSLFACRMQRNDNGEVLLSTDTISYKEPEQIVTVYGPVIELRWRPKLLPRKDPASDAESKQPESATGISNQ